MDHRDSLPGPGRKIGFQGISSSSSGGITPNEDANAYFTAAGITDQTEKDAVTVLANTLQASGAWDKMVRLYLISPTSKAAAAYCAKTLTQATITAGTQWNSSGILVTNFNYMADFSSTFSLSGWPNEDMHCSSYFTYASKTSDWYFGGWWASASNQFEFFIGYDQSEDKMIGRYGILGANENFQCVDPGTPSSGCYILNVDSSTSVSLLKNGTQVANDTGAKNGKSDYTYGFAIYNTAIAYSPIGGSTGISPCRIKSSTLGYSLTPAQKTSLNNALTAYNTALGRG